MRCQLVLFAALGYLALAATPVLAADFTWTGEGPPGTTGWNWSDPLNWSGLSAPGGAVGTLSFPQLSSVNCRPEAVGPPAFTCYQSHNDLTGLSADELSLDDGLGYQIGGEGLELGSGGIVTTTSAPSLGNPARLELPLALTADQTWSINATGNRGDVELSGNVEGEAYELGVEVNDSSFLNLRNDVEVGDVTISGEGGVSLLGFAGAPSLNGTDGNPTSVREYASLVVDKGGSSGPLLLEEESTLQVGETLNSRLMTGAAVLTVNGDVTLSPGSGLTTAISRTGSTVGADYSQLSASGSIQLAGASLLLVDGAQERVCEELAPGDEATLITTTGTLSGTFDEVPNESAVPVECFGEGESPWAKIEYFETGAAPRQVKATIIEASEIPKPTNIAPPTISGTAKAGQTLTLGRGSWANSPTAVSDIWEDCDSSGADCQPIAGATGQTYELTSAEVGHTIRVSETATNPAGTGEAALSSPTGVVQPDAAGNLGSGTGSSSGSPSGGSGPNPRVVAPTLRLRGGTLHVRHGKVGIRLECVGTGPCKGKATLFAADKSPGFRLERGRRLGRPTRVVLGRAKVSLQGGAHGRLVIHLKPVADRLMRERRKLKGRLTIAGTASGKRLRESVRVRLEAGRSS